ncbi:MAG: DUF1674 domain-containing protein [Chloroflexi bacterium]|nr:DUF1674 domain-containing protein [Chloroflexota bacterium]
MGKPDSDKSPAPLSGKHKAPSGKTVSAKKTAEKEIGGPKGLEPTRYGDWERKGITSDF